MPSTKKALSSSLPVLTKGRIANLGFLLMVLFNELLILFLPSPKIEKT